MEDEEERQDSDDDSSLGDERHSSMNEDEHHDKGIKLNQCQTSLMRSTMISANLGGDLCWSG